MFRGSCSLWREEPTCVNQEGILCGRIADTDGCSISDTCISDVDGIVRSGRRRSGRRLGRLSTSTAVAMLATELLGDGSSKTFLAWMAAGSVGGTPGEEL